MATSADDLEKRLAELKREVTKRGFNRHASLLNNVSELPIELQSPILTTPVVRESIRTIIMFPPQIQRGWHYVPRQALLFTSTGIIQLLASIWPGQEPQVTCLQACDLLYMKITLILLYGFLEIMARGQQVPVRLALEFNTVNWYSLSLPLQQFFEAADGLSGVPADKDAYSLTTQQTLEQLPLKFSNGLKIYGLLPGEELEEAVFQADIDRRWLYFFREPILANTLLLLTSHYMVVIQEELNVKQGWIVSYIPRRNIAGIENRPCDLWNELSVRLKRGGQSVDYKLKLKSETVEVWCRQWVRHGGG